MSEFQNEIGLEDENEHQKFFVNTTKTNPPCRPRNRERTTLPNLVAYHVRVMDEDRPQTQRLQHFVPFRKKIWCTTIAKALEDKEDGNNNRAAATSTTTPVPQLV